MTFFDVINLLGGLALFLYGMHLMGEGLQKSSGTALKKSLEKVTGNAFVGFLLGVGVTCVIQSSTATIVLTVGLVSAGVLTFKQAIGIVFGANVGTTVTAQMIRLLDIKDTGNIVLSIFKPDTLAPLAAVIGILFIMFIKRRSSNLYGTIAMGFGILFIGLLNMTAAVEPLSNSQAFFNLLAQFSASPLLGFVSGMVITAVVQSSSAVVGMLQVLCSTGALTFGSIYAIIIGVNIGTCVTTAAVCSIGAKADARRTGVIHIAFNVLGSILTIVILTVVHRAGLIDGLWNQVMTSGTIANFHTVFNLLTSIALLPFIPQLAKLANRLVHDDVDEGENVSAELEKMNERLFMSPPVALQSAHEAISAMGRISHHNVGNAIALFDKFDQHVVDKIEIDEDRIDHLADAVDNYLIKLSAHVDTKQNSDLLNFYIQSFPEYERIGDFAVNISENAAQLSENQMRLSDTALVELQIVSQALDEIIHLARDCFAEQNELTARKVEPLEEVMDDLVALLKTRHIDRLRNGECTVYSGLIFLDLLTNIERIADHCSNLAIYTLAQCNFISHGSHHDYIRELHQGNDKFYTDEYSRNYEKYYQTLQEIK